MNVAIKYCGKKRKKCDIHGMSELSDVISELSEHLECEFSNDTNSCSCHIINDLCVPLSKFKENVRDDAFKKKWILTVLGSQNVGIFENKEEMARLIKLKLKSISHINGEQCMTCMDLQVFVLNSINKKFI